MKKITKHLTIAFSLLFIISILSGCGGNAQDKEIKALMEQYAEYYSNKDEAGLKSLLVEGGKPMNFGGQKDDNFVGIKVDKIKDITPPPKQLKGFLRENLPPGLGVRYNVTFEYEIKGKNQKTPLKLMYEIDFLRDTEGSPFKLVGEKYDYQILK